MKRIALSILFIFIYLSSLMASRSSDFEYMKNTIASLHKDFYNSVSSIFTILIFSFTIHSRNSLNTFLIS